MQPRLQISACCGSSCMPRRSSGGRSARGKPWKPSFMFSNVEAILLSVSSHFDACIQLCSSPEAKFPITVVNGGSDVADIPPSRGHPSTRYSGEFLSRGLPSRRLSG
jgi:hypothetical protein